MTDPMTLILCGITAVALVAAALAHLAGRHYTDRELRALRRENNDANRRCAYLARELGKLNARVESYADSCDADSDDLAEFAERVRRLEERPTARQQMRDRMPSAVIALPAAPSVRDLIDPAWNGGTALHDQVAANFPSITDTSDLWYGVRTGRVQMPVTPRTDETGQIPRVVDGAVTGELEAVR
jgi:hypothetical protein